MRKIYYIIIFFLFLLIPISNACAIEFPEVSSSSVLFVNVDRDEEIYSKNPDEKVQIASLTKIMTAIVSIEHIKDYNEKITVTEEMLKNIDKDFSMAGFKAGEVVTYDDLLYGTLLPSGADATNILGYSVAGSIDEFVKLMNEKALELDMTNSHFSNTMGKTDDGNYSTARDLLKLLKYCYKNDKFKEVYGSETYTSSNSLHEMKGPVKKLHSDDLKMNYLLGAKTGYTQMAGLCLASVSDYDKDTYMLITLGANKQVSIQHMIDSRTIYNYFFDNYVYKKLLKKGEKILRLKTEYDEEYEIKSTEEVEKYIDKDVNKKDLTYKFSGSKVLQKGIKKNDKIGEFSILNKGEVLYTTAIYSPGTVHITLNYFVNHNKIFLITLSIVIILSIILHKKRKNRKR